MSNFPDNWQDIAWAKLSPELRQQAVDRLREVLRMSRGDLLSLMDKDVGAWHFFQGMGIRNLLRSNHGLDPVPKVPPIMDDQLPGLPEFYDGQDISTWDDFYVQAMEASLGLREIDVE